MKEEIARILSMLDAIIIVSKSINTTEGNAIHVLGIEVSNRILRITGDGEDEAEGAMLRKKIKWQDRI